MMAILLERREFLRATYLPLIYLGRPFPWRLRSDRNCERASYTIYFR